MKVYLLNPPYMPHFGRAMRWQNTGRGGTLYYPIWLSYTAALLEQSHEIRLIDAPAWNWDKNDVLDDVKIYEPDLIIMDSSFPSLNNDLSVSKFIKKGYDDAKIVLVGPPTSQFSQEILRNDGIDITARWEYDFTIKNLADKLEQDEKLDGHNLQDIEGISYKNEEKIFHNEQSQFTDSKDLDSIDFVSKIYKNHLNINDYFLGNSLYPEVQIFTGRGCPFHCTFCSWPETLMGRKYRVRSIDNVLDELEWIENNLPEVKEVFFEDDTFTIDKKRVLEFCEKYKERKLKITWACNARVGLDYETMSAMEKSNCRLLIVGFESANNEILKNIRKGFSVEEAKEFVKDIKKTNLLLHADFVIGLPGETKETIQKTRKFINDINAEMIQVSVASPFPGTEFYRYAKENNYLITDDPNEYLDEEGHQKSIISYPWLSSDEINQEVDDILKDFYLSFNYVPAAFRQVFRRNGISELRRLLRSAASFSSYLRRN